MGHPSANGVSGDTEVLPVQPEATLGWVRRVANQVRSETRVLILGREDAELARRLQERGCRAVVLEEEGLLPIEPRTPADSEGLAALARFDGQDGEDDRRFDVVVVADLLGRLDDPRPVLGMLKQQVRPGGSLMIVLAGIAQVDGQPTLLGRGGLGTGSRLVFTSEGLMDLLEEAGYAIGHWEWFGAATTASRIGKDKGNSMVGSDPTPISDCLIVAFPLPIPGLRHLQQQMRRLIRQKEEATREAREFRDWVELGKQRIEVLTGHERMLTERIKDLRARLLTLHDQLVRRDDEIRKTFGDAICHRNALLIEKDTLLAQNRSLCGGIDALIAERDAVIIGRDAVIAERDDVIIGRDAVIAERDELLREREALITRHDEAVARQNAAMGALQAAEVRLNRFRKSPLGRAYRAACKLIRRSAAL